MEPIEDEVFQYALGEVGGSMHSYIRLPEPMDAEELAGTIASARQDLAGYGVVRSTHGTRSYDLEGRVFDGEEPVYERISFQQLHDEDVDPVPHHEYIAALKEGEAAGLAVDDWNAYVRLDGEAAGFYLDHYSTQHHEEVFDAIFDAVAAEMETGTVWEPGTDPSLETETFLFENATGPGELYAHIDLPGPTDPGELADAVEAAVADADGYSPEQIPLGTTTYTVGSDGRPLRTLDETTVQAVMARGEIGADADQVVSASGRSGWLEKDNWGFYIEDDGPVSGLLVDRFTTGDPDDTALLDRVLDRLEDDLIY